MDAKRGYVPEDDRNFSREALDLLRTASRHILYLLEEGYDLKQATTFVGNHFLLSQRQRLAVMRSLATKDRCDKRKDKQVPLDKLSKKVVSIDGFNTIITLEVMLLDSPLFEGMDGAIRDLAALRGTYRLIPETREAIRILFDHLQKGDVGQARVFLDQPVSNSGRLKTLIAELGEDYTFGLDILILKGVDRVLYGRENVISSDSIVLDHCRTWVNLTGECLKDLGKCGVRVWDT